MIRLAISMLLLVLLSERATADTFNAYAGPNRWGDPVRLRGHIGAVTYTIEYTAVGNTQVIAEVTYVAPNGQFTTRRFFGSITFRTGNVTAQPSVKFKGLPTGSAVTVKTNP